MLGRGSELVSVDLPRSYYDGDAHVYSEILTILVVGMFTSYGIITFGTPLGNLWWKPFSLSLSRMRG